VIGERVRDKIAASKRKGIWVGGPVPLGYRCLDKKVLIVPEEAETVRTIFRRYLELGTIAALVADLDRRGIRTKSNKQSSGRVRGGIRFGVGPLAHLLKNRFYIGEVVYRGEVHVGEHEPVLDRERFEAVQEKLAANAVARKIRLRGRAAILTGRIYDDRGNRMSPTHSNKRGARYRYYVSHALLRNRKETAGSITRVPAPEIEKLVLEGVRMHLSSPKSQNLVSDNDLIAHQVDRVTVTPQVVQVLLSEGSPGSKEAGHDDPAAGAPPALALTLPWTAGSFVAVKGIVHEPAANSAIRSQNRDALLGAIAKAREWIDNLRRGRAASLTEIGAHEGLGERQVRLLASLAFVAPPIVAAIADATAPADVTVTSLARRLPHSWAEQERHLRRKSSS
jgi:site-specific DNA recombinase